VDIKLGKGADAVVSYLVPKGTIDIIDNQLRGRSGRQGDVGESQF
jgi:preprotein translocase subunit SecA